MQRASTRPLDDLNRRRSAPPDAWEQALRWIGLTGWTMILSAVFFFGIAKPQMETFFDRQNNVAVRKLWNPELADFALLLAAVALVVGLVGVGINLWRQQVKDEEEFRYNLVLLTAASLLLMVVCLLIR